MNLILVLGTLAAFAVVGLLGRGKTADEKRLGIRLPGPTAKERADYVILIAQDPASKASELIIAAKIALGLGYASTADVMKKRADALVQAMQAGESGALARTEPSKPSPEVRVEPGSAASEVHVETPQQFMGDLLGLATLGTYSPPKQDAGK